MWLIDIVKPDESFTVADYKKLAIKTISDIAKRNKLPIMVGGTGLYIRAVVDNLTIPDIPAQPKLRRTLEAKTSKELYEKLLLCDLKTAAVIGKHNKRRLVRALEVAIASGSSFADQRQKGEALFDALQIGIEVPKETLFRRIEKRVETMIASGLENEVRTLVKRYGWNSVLSNTIGYKEWRLLFEKNARIEDVITEVVRNTKQYVKKQLTWFKKDKRIHWITNKEEAKQRIESFLR